MFLAALKAIGSLFGFGAGQSIGNAVGGLALHTTIITLGVYFIHHYNDMVEVHVPLWNLALAAVVAYVVADYYRRKLPGGP